MTLLRLILEAIRRLLARRASIRASSLPPGEKLLPAAPREPASVPITATMRHIATAPTEGPYRAAPPRRLFTPPLPRIPSGTGEINLVFGCPYHPDDSIDRAWERASMVIAEKLPGAWNGRRAGEGRLYVHHKAEAYLREALLRCADKGVLGYIVKLGWFNPRRMRHDTPAKAKAEHRALLPWSRHTWGIAGDINDGDNQAHYFNGRAPAPWSDEWKKVWPRGVPREVVEAFESVGFRWGGRWAKVDSKGRVFVDPMHFELCR